MPQARFAFDDLMDSCPHEKPRAIFGERSGVGRDIGLVRLRVGDIDMSDPIRFGHGSLYTEVRLKSDPTLSDPTSI